MHKIPIIDSLAHLLIEFGGSMRLIAILAFVSSLSFAHTGNQKIDTTKAINKQMLSYASIYADELIDQFDKLLDYNIATNNKDNILHSQLYAKILSARSYIENFSDHQKYLNNPESILKVKDAFLYNQVVETINHNSKVIVQEQTHQKSLSLNDSIIYPSASKAGNVTGNTFPKKVWALTFDDGPRAHKTSKVVDNLYKRNIRATFFMLTEEAKKYKKEAMNVIDSGMNVALHSYTHPDLNKASSESLAYQITKAKVDLENLLNVKTSVFRLPYGSGLRNTKVRNVIAQNNYVHIFWNIDTLDWKDKDPQSVLQRVKKLMKITPNNSGIILFHDIHAATVVSSELTMDYLLDNGHRICTVEDVISYLNGKSNSCLK